MTKFTNFMKRISRGFGSESDENKPKALDRWNDFQDLTREELRFLDRFESYDHFQNHLIKLYGQGYFLKIKVSISQCIKLAMDYENRVLNIPLIDHILFRTSVNFWSRQSGAFRLTRNADECNIEISIPNAESLKILSYSIRNGYRQTLRVEGAWWKDIEDWVFEASRKDIADLEMQEAKFIEMCQEVDMTFEKKIANVEREYLRWKSNL